MVWAARDDAFNDGLAAARPWAKAHSHVLPPATAVWNEYPGGKWAKHMRDAARITDGSPWRRDAGETVGLEAGALTEERRQALDEIDPGWCPPWDTGWLCVACFSCRRTWSTGGVCPPRPWTSSSRARTSDAR
ncbi:helicase associated domain-containing protein [Streptomyces sp. NPDC006552]|uniref:helicase associated domain-containing protein n=1 Tax=Streptomyces sp. NPDC006552 TaxID=3157179 RepID=UPI0033AD6D5A